MAKKSFVNPFLLMLEIDPEDPTETGGNTGMGLLDPIDYESWCLMYGEENYDGNGTPGEFSDYKEWWKLNGLSAEEWEVFNPGEPLNP